MEKDNNIYKYSVIDIGSNSIRLLSAKVLNKKIVDSSKELVMTRMGFNVDKTKLLSEESMESTYKAIEKFYKDSLDNAYDLIGLIATSAVRDSLNKEEFINTVYKKTNLKVDVISGKEEARLGYLGVVSGLDFDFKNILIIDIGGGSTEFIIGNKKEILFSTSLDMGAVRFTEKYISNDIPQIDEIIKLDKDIADKLKEIYSSIMKYLPEACFGIGGTITTMGAIDLKMEVYNSEVF